ncbi:Diphthine synthase [Heterocephalus glaber]|uniref:diphthine methyl ester synthase n=1 Tax=Heterocephalus glaber TaxID=10181 RepID=G5AYQ7_HETGA|nr:Diphthine synthase [Heterocephalus glaber]
MPESNCVVQTSKAAGRSQLGICPDPREWGTSAQAKGFSQRLAIPLVSLPLEFEMLYLIGLGLGDAKDITVKGLEVVRRCSRVYLEAYTSVLTVGKEALEEFYGRKLILADREEVEQEADNILKDADINEVAFLVVGDPFGGRKIYEPPRYMSVNQAAQQLLEIVQNRREGGEEPAVTEETLCVGLARVGAEDQKIAAGTLQQMCTVDLGGPLHSLIITGGSMHPLEMEMLSLFSIPEQH